MSKSSAAILACCIALAAPGATSRAADPAPLSPQAAHDLLHMLDDAFAAVFQKVAPAVVVIEAEKKPAADDQDQNFDDNFQSPEGGEGGQPRKPQQFISSEGSGFIVRPDGYIYTNAHVIEGSEKIEVRLRDNRRFIARLVGADEHTDIAVLKIDADNLPVANLLDSDSVRVGQMCFAIGIPYQLDYSFCRGVVSATGRGNLISSDNNPIYEDYIQTDAFINPGNSGGPLFDIDGNVMGMNTLINGIGRGLAFAIPSNMLKDVGSEIIATGRVIHPWLGIKVGAVQDEPNASERFRGVDAGVCVEVIEAHAPAYKSDLRAYDVITRVDGVPVFSTHDLQREILHKKVGQSVNLSIWRAGKTLDLAVVTDELPDDLTKLGASQPATHPGGDPAYGLEFSPSRSSGQTEPVRDKVAGPAAVTAVLPGSPADRAGIQPGDIVTAIDEKPVADSASCLALLAAHRGAAGPLIFFERAGKKTRATLDTGGPANP